MYNTLYEITRNSYLKNIFISGEKIFFIGFIVFVCIVFYLNYSLKKLCKEENIPIQELKEDEIYKKIRLLKYISIVLLPIFVILCISSIPEDIAVRDYVYNQYKSGNFHVAEGKVEKYGNDVCAVFGENKIILPAEKAQILTKSGYVGKSVTFGIRPEHLSDDADLIAANPGSIVKGHVEVIELMGSESYIYTKCGNSSLNIKIEGSTELKIGEVASLYLKAEKLHVFDKETELRVV